ncbi:O-antigen ligase family protein [Gaoshiqia sediminis]|uniref:O-antigen ligase family protein n=1 Tax=Gaoshiqia sediminis TaxID=2986998 RepID=A0AA41YDP5_9BACT|nr:O-antigen ligase family protein [Gaoshiqia sediminis]MCW0484958.1 O-antigen ligase family protein [Gaoshiqia sediminis]
MMERLKNTDWFYLSLMLLVVSLPFSAGMISVAAVLLFIVSLFRISQNNFRNKLAAGRNLLIFASVFLVYLFGLLICRDWKWGLYDLQKNIPFLMIPLAFVFGPQLSARKSKKLLLIFALAVVLSALSAVVLFYGSTRLSVLEAQELGFVHHIRFSFQVILSILILSIPLILAYSEMSLREKFLRLGGGLFLVLFLFWHQSLTGIISFLGTAFAGGVLLLFQINGRVQRMLLGMSLMLLILIPSVYLAYAINRFYDLDPLDPTSLEDRTSLGNPYTHHLENPQLENGHYVGLYWCEQEMEKAWNQRAEIKYNEPDQHGYQIKETLVRYLTSKNLRKDAAGVSQLTSEDIRNIEAGISNHILARKGLSLYPRIYVSIWEVDNYLKTGYANARSLALRMEYSKAAWHIIRDHFWFGVGTGNWKAAFDDAYHQLGSQMEPEWYSSAHNQYLNYWVKFGLVGLLLILSLIIFPVVKTKAYRNSVFLLFLVSMFLANFADSNLETHVGGHFFVFVYCLFVASENI